MLNIDNREVLRNRAAPCRLERPDSKSRRLTTLEAFVPWQKNCRDTGYTGCKALPERESYRVNPVFFRNTYTSSTHIEAIKPMVDHAFQLELRAIGRA